jgi:hypothetical protein
MPSWNAVMRVEPVTPRRRDWLPLAAVLACALVVAGTWIYQATAPRRAILALPPPERAELFTRTRAEAEALCVRHEPLFEDECHRHLELLVAFPECGEECQQFARAHLHRPVR